MPTSGCGHGASTILLAQTYPDLDVHRVRLPRRLDRGRRKRASEAGVADRVTFEVASAQSFPGTGYDLVATFDCLHDMGDPVGAARHIRESLAADGTWLVVEPAAGDNVADNLNPVGRVYYSFSTFLCVPNGLSQHGGYALGAQAGEAAIRGAVTEGGFTGSGRARRPRSTSCTKAGPEALNERAVIAVLPEVPRGRGCPRRRGAAASARRVSAQSPRRKGKHHAPVHPQ